MLSNWVKGILLAVDIMIIITIFNSVRLYEENIQCLLLSNNKCKFVKKEQLTIMPTHGNNNNSGRLYMGRSIFI